MTIYLHFGLEEKSTEDHPPYWQALGRFMDAFAKLEAQIFVLLMHKGQVPSNTARAVFSGTRADQALTFLRRIHEGRGEPIPDYAGRAMAQFNVVNSARNNIVHYGASADGAFLVSNAFKTIPGRAQEGCFLPHTIDAMRADLETISAAFYVWLINGHPDSWAENGRGWAEIALDPWQYAPPPKLNIDRKR
jgi:hypothetical protein